MNPEENELPFDRGFREGMKVFGRRLARTFVYYAVAVFGSMIVGLMIMAAMALFSH